MANHRMDPRRLAALVSSLVAELLLSLPHHPSAAATTTTTTATAATTTSTLITLLYLLNSTTTTTSLSLLRPPPKRRKLSSSSSSSSSSTSSSQSTPPAPAPAAAPAAAPGHSLDPFLPFFRMSSASFQWLCGLLDPLLDCRDPVGSPLHLPPDLRLAIALFRLSTASPYSSVASRFRVSLPTARFCTKHLCRVLCTNFRFWLSFPSTIPPSPHFPNCSGIIHSSRFHSIAAQLVVDASCRILSIVAAFHKGVSTSTVLKSSALYKDVEEGKVLNGPAIRVGGEVDVPQYLVGDGGFPLLPWLIVPFLHPAPSSGEEEFNVAIRKMQLPALRTVRSLRNWGVLSKPIEEAQEEEDEEEEDEEEGVKMAVACVGACSILHNALLMREDYSALSDEIEDYSFHEPMPLDYGNHGVDNEAAAIRRALLAHTREVRHSN